MVGQSPLKSPINAPSKPASTFLTPVMKDVTIRLPFGISTPNATSSSVTSKNPHINPLMFETPSNCQQSNLGSPSTVGTGITLSSVPNPTNLSKKRPAKVIDLDSDLGQGVDGHSDDLPDLDLFGTGDDQAQSTSTHKSNESQTARNYQVTFNIWQPQLSPLKHANGKRRKKTPGGV